jgi:DNA-binding transcriptional ArsR family regulator
LRPQDHTEVVALHARLCQALADPKRLLLIYALADGPRTVSELCAELDLPQTNVSQHLAILRDRGIVASARNGTNVTYRLRGLQVVQALDLLRDYLREVLSTGT